MKIFLILFFVFPCFSFIEASVIGHWRFEESGFSDGATLPSGSNLILDSSGNGNHATVRTSGLTYESGAGDTFAPGSNQSIRNSGSGSLEIASINLGAGNTPWTVELFVKKTSNTGTFDDLLMTRATNEAGRASNFGFHLRLDGSNTRMQFFGDNGNPTDSTVLPLNTWHHLAITNDGSQYEFFVDGVSTGVAAGNFHFNGLVIGFTDENYIGFMDEVRVSNEVLASSQFFNGAVPEPGTFLSTLLALVLFWNFRLRR